MCSSFFLVFTSMQFSIFISFIYFYNVIIHQCSVLSISKKHPQCPECKCSLNQLDIHYLHTQHNFIAQNDQFQQQTTVSLSPPTFIQYVMVTMLNGTCFKVSYHKYTTVLDFQQRLEKKSGIKAENQKLMYENTELTVSNSI